MIEFDPSSRPPRVLVLLEDSTMRAMPRSCRGAPRLASALALAAAAFFAAMAPAIARSDNPGLVGDNRYESPQFDFALTWQAPWRIAAGTVVSNTGSYDQIGLENGDATAQIVLFTSTVGLDNLFKQVEMGIQSGGADVQEIATVSGDGDRAATFDLTATWQDKTQRIRRYVEVVDFTRPGDAGSIYFFGAIGAPVDTFADAWASFSASVRRDGEQPVFRDVPILLPATPAAADDHVETILPGVKSYDYAFGQHDDNFHEWPEVPPVGGKHNHVWQKCQFYDKPIDSGKAVHSLEHGAVWITFVPDLPQDQIDKIKAIANGQDYVLASPYPGQPAPIVLTSWNHQLQLQTFDQQVIDQFIKVFKHSPDYTPEYVANCATGSTDTVAT
jgi:hypothetical protein